MTILLLTTVIPILVALVTGSITYLVARRNTSGQIKTSEAADLWEQTRAIMDDLRAAKERAEDQRDRLLELQRESTQPALEAISLSQKHVLELLNDTLTSIDSINSKAERLERVILALETYLHLEIGEA